jgi:hypothetical protein
MVVSEKAKRILHQFAVWTVDGVFWLSILVMAYVFVLVFLFTSFKIPSDSKPVQSNTAKQQKPP